MRVLLLAVAAVLTLSVATTAFAKGGGTDAGEQANSAGNAQYYGQ
jgi:hypothetical protein